MTRQILDVIKKKDYWYHKWRHNKSNEYYLRQFKHTRNKTVALMRTRKKEFYSSLITHASGNTKKIWNTLKEVIGHSQKVHLAPDNVTQITVETFNYYFTSVGPDLAAKICTSNTHNPILTPISNTFVMEDIELNEIVAIVNSLPKNKAAGLDGITARLIQENIDILGPILCNLFNHSLLDGIYPSRLKIAKVTPVFKEGDRSEPSSYRPISVLSAINIIFEKLIAKRVHKFLEKYRVICPQQHGFRPRYSTSTAVLSLTQMLNTTLHNNKLAAVVFLDLQKAFDTVDHSIMLDKLKNYGFRDKTFHLFSSFLTDRQQKVSINNITSSLRYITTGVPQGSVLGPLLFTLYVNDLCQIISSEMLMYADDTAVIFTADTEDELQDKLNIELAKISNWFSTNKLTINTKKTKYMIFHSPRKLVNYSIIKPIINDNALQQTSSFKYLGIIFDSNLNWKNQITHVCSKVASGCYALLQARDCFDANILLILYHAFISSHLTYCLESWGWTFTTYLNPIRRLQKRVIRIMNFAKYNEHSKPLFTQLQLLPFDHMREDKTVRITYSIVRNNHPFPVSLFNSPLRHTRNFSLNNFNLPLTHNVYGERLIQYVGAKVWNKIPVDLRNDHNFCKKLKNHFLLLYSHECPQH